MFFTEEDYRKIEKWLVSKGIMDTQFSPATTLDGNETIAIVQNGKNVNTTIDALVEKLFLLGVNDFLNITDKYNQPAISLIQAISLIPFRHRKIGQVITFLNEDNKWVIYQFQGSSLIQWNNTTQWVNVIGSAITGELVPDEEDLTGIKEGDNTVLKFKNKAYSTANFSGLGRVYLRKNIAGGRNILTQQMINQENTRYILQYDYDLNGQTITIPNNCVIEFEGGSITNGTIILNNTKIIGENTSIVNVIGDTYSSKVKLSEGVLPLVVELYFANLHNCTIHTRYKVGTPKRYGGVGDGITDDSSAIQCALDVVSYNGGWVSFKREDNDNSNLWLTTKPLNVISNTIDSTFKRETSSIKGIIGDTSDKYTDNPTTLIGKNLGSLEAVFSIEWSGKYKS